MTMGLLVTRVQRHEMGWFCSIGFENSWAEAYY